MIYGGWRALVKSPFFWAAIALTGLCYPLWSAVSDGTRIWAQNAIDIVPSMLGFSLGGMAILLALSSRQLLRAIRKDGAPDSLFMRTVAAFFHFILFQTAAVCGALLSKAYSNDVVSAIGFFLLTYAVLVAIAIAWNLFDIARIFNATGSFSDDDTSQSG